MTGMLIVSGNLTHYIDQFVVFLYNSVDFSNVEFHVVSALTDSMAAFTSYSLIFYNRTGYRALSYFFGQNVRQFQSRDFKTTDLFEICRRRHFIKLYGKTKDKSTQAGKCQGLFNAIVNLGEACQKQK